MEMKQHPHKLPFGIRVYYYVFKGIYGRLGSHMTNNLFAGYMMRKYVKRHGLGNTPIQIGKK